MTEIFGLVLESEYAGAYDLGKDKDLCRRVRHKANVSYRCLPGPRNAGREKTATFTVNGT
jgi:hypothetical protein